MHKYNFDSDETFNSIEDFLDKCCTYWNLTGNHTRNIYQAEFDGVDIEPYRVCRRVNILRDYPDDKIKIYP